MSALVRASHSRRVERSKWPFLLVGIALTALCGFLVLPGSIAAKTHLALHGICAQRPSHSLHLGATALPLDARMTGIYVGAITTAIWLVAIGRGRSVALPPRSVVVLLIGFVVVLAGDGINALAVDLDLPHPYQPSNSLRLITGILCGIAMGVVVVHLLAATLLARVDRSRPIVHRPALLCVPLLIGLAVGALALSGLPILYAPFAVGLLVAAVGVFATLVTIVIALVTGRGWTYGSFREAAPLACAGIVVAMGVMAALSAARLAAESWFGLPRLT